jgi:uncharacterized protein (TIGR04255 family)
LPLPNSIEKCPIVDALVEARFVSNLPDEAVFGVLYEPLSKEFAKVVNLPILQLPPQIRNLNPQLRFQPTHRLDANEYYVSIGPKVVIFGIKMPYPGWTAFRAKLISLFGAVVGKSVVNKLQRLGFRYVNMFEGDATPRLTLQTKLRDQVVEGKKTYFRTTLERDGSSVTLKVAKDQTAKRQPDFKRTGTLIDIDVFRSTSEPFEAANLTSFVDAAHGTAKALFFDLLQPDFLQELNPTY